MMAHVTFIPRRVQQPGLSKAKSQLQPPLPQPMTGPPLGGLRPPPGPPYPPAQREAGPSQGPPYPPPQREAAHSRSAPAGTSDRGSGPNEEGPIPLYQTHMRQQTASTSRGVGTPQGVPPSLSSMGPPTSYHRHEQGPWGSEAGWPRPPAQYGAPRPPPPVDLTGPPGPSLDLTSPPGPSIDLTGPPGPPSPDWGLDENEYDEQQEMLMHEEEERNLWSPIRAAGAQVQFRGPGPVQGGPDPGQGGPGGSGRFTAEQARADPVQGGAEGSGRFTAEQARADPVQGGPGGSGRFTVEQARTDLQPSSNLAFGALPQHTSRQLAPPPEHSPSSHPSRQLTPPPRHSPPSHNVPTAFPRASTSTSPPPHAGSEAGPPEDENLPPYHRAPLGQGPASRVHDEGSLGQERRQAHRDPLPSCAVNVALDNNTERESNPHIAAVHPSAPAPPAGSTVPLGRLSRRRLNQSQLQPVPDPDPVPSQLGGLPATEASHSVPGTGFGVNSHHAGGALPKSVPPEDDMINLISDDEEEDVKIMPNIKPDPDGPAAKIKPDPDRPAARITPDLDGLAPKIKPDPDGPAARITPDPDWPAPKITPDPDWPAPKITPDPDWPAPKIKLDPDMPPPKIKPDPDGPAAKLARLSATSATGSTRLGLSFPKLNPSLEQSIDTNLALARAGPSPQGRPPKVALSSAGSSTAQQGSTLGRDGGAAGTSPQTPMGGAYLSQSNAPSHHTPHPSPAQGGGGSGTNSCPFSRSSDGLPPAMYLSQIPAALAKASHSSLPVRVLIAATIHSTYQSETWVEDGTALVKVQLSGPAFQQLIGDASLREKANAAQAKSATATKGFEGVMQLCYKSMPTASHSSLPLLETLQPFSSADTYFSPSTLAKRVTYIDFHRRLQQSITHQQ
eukprot:gene26119-11837_t